MSLPEITINQLSYSTDLFKNEGGLPMTFYVYPSSDSNDIVQLILKGGGTVVNVDHPGAIYLSSSTKLVEKAKSCVCTSFIYSCCFNNKLLDIDEYRLNSPQCSCQSVFGTLDKINEIITCNVHNNTNSSNKNIWNIVRHITYNEDLWKAIAETKDFGDSTWRNIRNDFALWAFLKLKFSTEEHDSNFSCFISSLKVNLQKDPCTNRNKISKTVHIPLLLPKTEEEETMEVSGKNNERLEPSSEKDTQALVICEEEENGTEMDSNVDDGECLTNEHVKNLSCLKSVPGGLNEQCSLSEEEVVNPSEVIAGQNISEIDNCEPGHSRWLSTSVTKTSHNPIEKKASSSAGVCEEVSEGETTDDEIGQGMVENNLVKRVSETEVESSVNKEKVDSLGEESARMEVMCEEVGEKTEAGSVVSGTWLGKDQMQSLSSAYGGRKPISEEETVNKNTSDDEIDDCDGDIKSEKSKKYWPKPWRLRKYSMEEDMKLTLWVIEKRRSITSLYGNRIWQYMEKKEILPSRSWQSLRERFRRHIVPNLKKYPLSKEDLRRLKKML